MNPVKTTIDKIREFRTEYFNSMPEFQELYIELMIDDSDYYLIQTDGNDIGYAIINTDDILIEFYVIDKYVAGSYEIFRQLVKELSVTEIYCKSFDSLLLSNCLLCSFPYSVIGVLYRDYVEPMVLPDPGITMIKSDLSSIGLFKEQDDSIKELFETDDQLTGFITKENVFEFYRNDEFVGCGMVIITNPDWNYCDLGVWVKPSSRGKKIGSQIILRLREFAIGNSLKPSCGCAVENIASQKTIERSGFVSRHKLISFKAK
ncbi:MAG: GNAT family N-acetyltransferase [Bacteroidales bacterium]